MNANFSTLLLGMILWIPFAGCSDRPSPTPITPAVDADDLAAASSGTTDEKPKPSQGSGSTN